MWTENEAIEWGEKKLLFLSCPQIHACVHEYYNVHMFSNKKSQHHCVIDFCVMHNQSKKPLYDFYDLNVFIKLVDIIITCLF